MDQPSRPKLADKTGVSRTHTSRDCQHAPPTLGHGTVLPLIITIVGIIGGWGARRVSFIYRELDLTPYLGQVVDIARATVIIRFVLSSLHRVVLSLTNWVPPAIESPSKMHAVLIQLWRGVWPSFTFDPLDCYVATCDPSLQLSLLCCARVQHVLIAASVH